MPNHVTTILEAPKEVLDFLRSDESEVDFNTVIPQPPEVRMSPDMLPFDYKGPNWYDWNIQYWGTKWNAYDIDRVSDNILKFETAWSHPDPVINGLSLEFPLASISVKYADEDLGANLGEYVILGGEKQRAKSFEAYSEEALEFAANIVHNKPWAQLKAEWDADW